MLTTIKAGLGRGRKFQSCDMDVSKHKEAIALATAPPSGAPSSKFQNKNNYSLLLKIFEFVFHLVFL